MTADQFGDNKPSFEELIKRQLDPLYQQEASKRKLIEGAEGVAADAQNATERQQKQEFLEKQGEIRQLLNGHGISKFLLQL